MFNLINLIAFAEIKRVAWCDAKHCWIIEASNKLNLEKYKIWNE